MVFNWPAPDQDEPVFDGWPEQERDCWRDEYADVTTEAVENSLPKYGPGSRVSVKDHCGEPILWEGTVTAKRSPGYYTVKFDTGITQVVHQDEIVRGHETCDCGSALKGECRVDDGCGG